MSRIRFLQWVAWFAIAGALVAVVIHGHYSPAIRLVHGVALAAIGVLIALERRGPRAQRKRQARRHAAQLD